MTQIARASTTTTAAPANRVPTAVRDVASFDRSPVEEISPQVGANFNESAFNFSNEKQGLSGQRGRPGGNMFGRFTAPSQTFVSLMEDSDSFSGAAGGAPASRKRDFAGLVAKAVQIYETNAKIIQGTNNVLGTSLSINL